MKPAYLPTFLPPTLLPYYLTYLSTFLHFYIPTFLSSYLPTSPSQLHYLAGVHLSCNKTAYFKEPEGMALLRILRYRADGSLQVHRGGGPDGRGGHLDVQLA